MVTSVPALRCDGRHERRMQKRLAVELSRPDRSLPKEMTFTENVSLRGVLVTTRRPWQPGTRVQVSFPKDRILIQGRVIYSQRKQNGDFAVGLEISW